MLGSCCTREGVIKRRIADAWRVESPHRYLREEDREIHRGRERQRDRETERDREIKRETDRERVRGRVRVDQTDL
jgi:hypothetical protein